MLGDPLSLIERAERQLIYTGDDPEKIAERYRKLTITWRLRADILSTRIKPESYTFTMEEAVCSRMPISRVYSSFLEPDRISSAEPVVVVSVGASVYSRQTTHSNNAVALDGFGAIRVIVHDSRRDGFTDHHHPQRTKACTAHHVSANLTSFLLTLSCLASLCASIAQLPLLFVATSSLLTSRLHLAVFFLYFGAHPASTYPLQHVQLALAERQTSTLWTVPLRGWPNTGYCTMMQFGINKQQMFCMIVDTGSSNTAVATTYDQGLGGMEIFDINSTGQDFIDLGTSVSVTYSSGQWSGYLVRDRVGFGDFSMDDGPFALITSSTEFFIEGADWVGILGLAYRSLVKPRPEVGTVWDSVRGANSLQDLFSMQLCPPRESILFPGTFVKQGGYMTLGGINNSLYHTDKQIHYTKIVEERFFNVLLTDISVGDRKINMSCKEFNTDKTIVDSGTTDIYFPDKVFQAVKGCFTEYFKDGVPMTVPEEFWMGESKLLWQAAHVEEIYQCFPTIHLSMADHLNSSQEFSLAVVPQLYLRQIDVQVGEADPAMCPPTSPCDAFTFGVKPRVQGTVIGANAMLGYYTVFDRENKRVGFAESTCDYRSTQAAPYISGPHPREPEDCEMPAMSTHWATITYCCGAITMTLAAMMTVIVITVQVKRCSRKSCVNKSATMPKRMIKKVKTAHHSAMESVSKAKTLCCMRLETPVTESYDSETIASPSVYISEEIPSPEDDEGNDEMIVSITPQSVMAVEARGAEMVANELAIKKAQINGAAVVPRGKGGGSKRWKKRHQPVMESGEGGLDLLCIERHSRPRPIAATNRSYDTTTVCVPDGTLYSEPYTFNNIVSRTEECMV